MTLSDNLLEDRVYARCIKEGAYDAAFVNGILRELKIDESKFLLNPR